MLEASNLPDHAARIDPTPSTRCFRSMQDVWCTANSLASSAPSWFSPLADLCADVCRFRWALGEAGAALAAPETAVPEPPARRRVVEASTTPTEAQQGSQLLHMLDYELSESDVRYVDGVVHRLAEAFELIVALAGGNAVRQFYDESIGAHVNSQTSATGGCKDTDCSQRTCLCSLPNWRL